MLHFLAGLMVVSPRSWLGLTKVTLANSPGQGAVGNGLVEPAVQDLLNSDYIARKRLI